MFLTLLDTSYRFLSLISETRWSFSLFKPVTLCTCFTLVCQ